MTESLPAIIRTALFVPATRPDRFGTAVASAPDLVVVDLEDSVAVKDKGQARRAVEVALSTGRLSAAIRINARADGGEDDIALLERVTQNSDTNLRAVLVPKVQSPDDISYVARVLPGVPIVALIETAAGVSACDAVAGSAGIAMLAFGALDFAADVGSTSPTMLDAARCRIVVSSRAANIRAPLDSPNPVFRDSDAVEAGARAARDLGFGGQLCIHPRQVPIVRDAFAPTAVDIRWAERVLDAAKAQDGIGQLDGSMIDRPVIMRASEILRIRDGQTPQHDADIPPRP